MPSCDDNGIPFTISFYYDELADGHVPQAVHEELVEGSTVVWTRDDLYQEFGNYFNVASYPQGGAALSQTSIVTYSVTITYDDGVTQKRSPQPSTLRPRGASLPRRSRQPRQPRQPRQR